MTGSGQNYKIKEKQVYLHNWEGELYLAEYELGHIFYHEHASKLGTNHCRYKLTKKEAIECEIAKQQKNADRFLKDVEILNKMLDEVSNEA